jgi:uncharacterized protein (DUF362 family)
MPRTEYRAYISKVTNLKETIDQNLEFVNWKKSLSKDSTVFIKPNFTYPFHKEGVTTNPEVIRCLLEIMKDNSGRVILGESNGGNRSFTADQAFEGHGMPKICKETGTELVNLSKIPYEIVEDTVQGKQVKVLLPKLLLHDVDYFVSLPVLKVHAMTNITLSMKNLWGCHPDTLRCLQHKDLSRKLALITKSLNPQLVLIDGTYALDGHGPMYGTPIKTDLIISANNPVVADALGAAVMQIPLSKVEHILIAEQEKLGTSDLTQVIINEDWTKYSMPFKVNKTVVDTLSQLLFKSEICAKIVMDSPATPYIYSIVSKLRNNDEKNVVDELKKEHQ